MSDTFTQWESAGGNNADHIGGNGYEFSYQDKDGNSASIQVDYGSLFCKKEQTGYDCFIPAVPNCDDILITHGHMDHVGGIAHLMNIKREEYKQKRAEGKNLTLHCTPFAAEMIKDSLTSTGIPKEEFPDFHVIKDGEVFEVNGFKVEPFAVSHSIPDSVGFVIESPNGDRMMTTGDFKTAQVPMGQGWNDERIAEIAAKGVDFLYIDSTSASAEGETKSEAEVEKGLRDLMDQSQDGPIISGVISSSCHRLHTVAKVVAEQARDQAEAFYRENGYRIVPEPRTIILDGASVIRARRAMNACGYKLEDMIEAETGVRPVIVASNTKTAKECPPERRFYVCTGTQGEEASLKKTAEGRNKNISLNEIRSHGDMPIYVFDLQSCIPGSEETHKDLQDKFKAQGCKTYFPDRYKKNDFTIHASGHGSAGDVEKLCRKVAEKSPRQTMVVPVHGDPEQRKKVMKIAQKSGLRALIVPNFCQMTVTPDSISTGESPKKEAWIGVNDLNNDFRRPYFRYDKLEMDVETKTRKKVGYYKFQRAEKKKGADAVQKNAVILAAAQKSRA